MLLNAPSKSLQSDLDKVSTKLKKTSVGLLGIAVRLSDSGFDGEARKLLAAARDLNSAEDVVQAYAKEVRAGIIVRLSLN